MGEKVDVLAGHVRKHMRRWSDEKLERELSFAEQCNDGSDECVAWLAACLAESKRRVALARIGAA